MYIYIYIYIYKQPVLIQALHFSIRTGFVYTQYNPNMTVCLFFLKEIYIYIYTVLFQTLHFRIRTVFLCAQLNFKTILFQAIQLSLQAQFSSIWSRDRTLYHSGPQWTWERWQWRGVPHPTKLQNYWSFTIRWFSVTSKKLVGGDLIPLQSSNSCILRPLSIGQLVVGFIPLHWYSWSILQL